jgi:hypothetical protein
MRLALLLLALQVPSADTARERAWREDLDSALTVFLTKERSFSPVARRAFERRVRGLRDSVRVLEDDALVVRLATAVASAENAHTRLYLLRNRTVLHRLPVRVWWFGDELRVVRAREDQADLLGARITHIAGRPVHEVARLVAPLYAGSAGWKRYIATYTMTSPEVLHGLGLRADTSGVEIRAVTRAGSAVRLLVPLPLQKTNEPTEAWWDLGPMHPGRQGPWVSPLPSDTTRLPLYLRYPTQNYWTAWLPGSRTLYLNYQRAQDQPDGETTRAFGDRLLAEIAERDPARLVIDLRFNTGGNLDLAEPLFDRIAALPLARERGRLFVIVGRTTFSAGMTPAVALQERTRAIFVGEPLGDALDYWSEGGNIVLPNSRLTMHYADRFHSYSRVEHPEYKPYVRDYALDRFRLDVPVSLTFAQWLAGRDPAMETVLRWRR